MTATQGNRHIAAIAQILAGSGTAKTNWDWAKASAIVDALNADLFPADLATERTEWAVRITTTATQVTGLEQPLTVYPYEAAARMAYRSAMRRAREALPVPIDVALLCRTVREATTETQAWAVAGPWSVAITAAWMGDA